MKKYKVYAKILGHVLPEEKLEIGDCKIEKMSYREQKERNFQPLRGWKVREFNMNYMTFPRGSDFRIMRSNFVISTIIDTGGSNEALGFAEDIFDKIIGVFMLYMNYWWLERYPRSKNRFSGYDYQICKLYEIVNDKEIEVKDLGPISSSSSMCRYPEFKELTNDFEKITDQYLSCKDEIFERSLEYFVDGIRGINLFLPEEKIFLDLFKSIELIIKGLKIKRKNFRDRLKNGLKKLGLEDTEIEEIIKFYKIRSDGNFAHARIKRFGYPSRYPIPHDSGLLFDISQLKYLSHKVLVNYFNYIKDRYEVLINSSKNEDLESENTLIQILENFPPNSWNHNFVFNTKEKKKRKITQLIKKEYSKRFKISLNRVRVLKSGREKLIIGLK